MIVTWRSGARCGVARRGVARCGVAALGLALLAGPAQAQETYETHDGFMLRMVIGGGAFSAENGDGQGSTRIDGSGSPFNLTLGGVIAPNLILHGTLLAVAAPEPEVEVRGVGTVVEEDGISLSGVGVGLSYYFMPTNLYVSGNLISVQMSAVDEDNNTFDTEAGWGLLLELGKEWWVSDNWGLGVGGQFMMASLDPDRDQTPPGGETPPSWTVRSINLLFTATYN